MDDAMGEGTLALSGEAMPEQWGPLMLSGPHP